MTFRKLCYENFDATCGACKTPSGSELIHKYQILLRKKESATKIVSFLDVIQTDVASKWN